MDPTQIAPHTFDITPYLQLGSFGVLVLFFGYLLRVQIPRMELANEKRELRADARDAKFLESIEKLHADCEEQKKELLGRFDEMLSHQRANHREETALMRASEERRSEKLSDAIANVGRRERTGGGGA